MAGRNVRFAVLSLPPPHRLVANGALQIQCGMLLMTYRMSRRLEIGRIGGCLLRSLLPRKDGHSQAPSAQSVRAMQNYTLNSGSASGNVTAASRFLFWWLLAL